MAARDGDISDEELRRQLKALGEDVGPVTDNTRSFLFRKLKRLRNQQGSSRLRKEKTPPRRRPSPARKSLPATTRSQSPSRKRFGFSSDEEDAGPSLSITLRDSDRLRGRRSEAASSDGESLGRSEKTKPTPTRRGELRQRVPSFIEHSVPERTFDSTDGHNGEFSDQDGPVFLKPKTHSSGVSRYTRTTRREIDESEGSETMRSSTTYGKYESVNAGSQLNTTLRERQSGAKDVKTSLFWSLTGKIVLVISVICIGILLYVALKKHSSEKGLLEQFVKLPVCKGDNQVQEYKDKPPGCVPLLNISKHYADSLYKKLIVKAGLFECEDPSVDSRNVSKEELRKEIRKDNYTRPGDEQKLILKKTLELILKHPEWKLRYHSDRILT